MREFLLGLNRVALPVMALLLAGVCLAWLARHKGAGPPEAWLLNTVNHDKLELRYWENSVGRHHRCDVVLNYGTVSRHHAVIARRKDGWVLTDTGSRGGTTRNGEVVKGSVPLEHRDAVMFGAFECVFCDPAEELARAEREAEMFRQQQWRQGGLE